MYRSLKQSLKTISWWLLSQEFSRNLEGAVTAEAAVTEKQLLLKTSVPESLSGLQIDGKRDSSKGVFL